MFISRRYKYPESLKLWRSTGFYMHLPKKYYYGYARIVTKKKLYTLWYHGNPYRPGKIFEVSDRTKLFGG